MAKRILLALACALGLVAPVGAQAARSAHPAHVRPIRVLVWSGQFPGSIYYHAESNAREKKAFPTWGPEFQFHFADCVPPDTTSTSPVICSTKQDAAALKKSNLEKYDVLVMFNASGNYPPPLRDDLVAWLREGHGLYSVSSVADGNYEWPQFSDLVGARAEDHYILAPGDPKSAPAMVAVNEDPKNPLVAHLGARYTFSDETYKWKIDPRPDVHVLLSFDNTSMPQGDLFQPHMPLVWCKEPLGGRTVHMAYGHSGFIFGDAGIVTMMKQSIRWLAGRLSGVDCSVPGTQRRLEAVWADRVAGGRAAVSSESGALAVVTDFPSHTGRIEWRHVNLTGVRSLELRASGESEQPTPSFPQPQPPPQPAAGGAIEAHLDSPHGRLLGTFDVQGNPRWDQANPSAGNTGPQPGWASYIVTLAKPVHGRHTIWLVAGAPGSLGAAAPVDASGQTKYGVIGTVAWLKLR